MVRAQERPRRIAILVPATADDPLFQIRLGAFLQGLQQSGWSIGRNIRIDTRWATANSAEIRRHAAELAAQAPEVVLASGGSAVSAMLQATRTLPLVFPIATDPVGSGFVETLARPGGNVTGFMNFEYGMGGKWVELLQQIAPQIQRVGVVREPALGTGSMQLPRCRRLRRR